MAYFRDKYCEDTISREDRFRLIFRFRQVSLARESNPKRCQTRNIGVYHVGQGLLLVVTELFRSSDSESQFSESLGTVGDQSGSFSPYSTNTLLCSDTGRQYFCLRSNNGNRRWERYVICTICICKSCSRHENTTCKSYGSDCF